MHSEVLFKELLAFPGLTPGFLPARRCFEFYKKGLECFVCTVLFKTQELPPSAPSIYVQKKTIAVDDMVRRLYCQYYW